MLAGLLLLHLACSRPPLIPPPPDTGPESEALELFQGLHAPWRPSEEALQRLRLMERLEHYGVPGVQIAVIDEGELRWSKAWGQAAGDLEDGRVMEPATRLQVGSISKLLAATAGLRHAAASQDLGAALDREIGGAPGPGVTPRRLLSHTAGLDTPSFAGHRRNEPAPPAVPVRQSVAAGESWRYSGGGYQLLEVWLEGETGLGYDELLRQEIFEPLEMDDTGFDPPTGDRLAVGHGPYGEPIPGGYRVYPELAAAGLWSTAEDLSAWVIDIQKSQAGKPRRRLDRDTTLAMLTPQEPGGWGLGPQLGGEGHATYFGHLGGAEGYRGLVLGFKVSGHGAVILTNGDGGVPLIREIVAGLASLYDWPALKPRARDVAPQTGEALGRLVGRYAIPAIPGAHLDLRLDDDVLVAEAFGETTPLLAETADLYFDRVHGYEIEVLGRGPAGRAETLELRTFPSYRFVAERVDAASGSPGP